jgi:hypothetical protein
VNLRNFYSLFSKLENMDAQEYIQQRVDDQLNWFEKKSAWNQSRYKWLRTGTIAASVSIPVLSGMIAQFSWLTYVVGALGAMVALIEGILSLNKYQDNWVHYRSTAEALKREKLLFQTRSGLYQKAQDPFHLLVSQVETILQSENQAWRESTTKEEDGGE